MSEQREPTGTERMSDIANDVAKTLTGTGLHRDDKLGAEDNDRLTRPGEPPLDRDDAEHKSDTSGEVPVENLE